MADSDIIKIVGVLAACYPHAQISSATIDAYVGMLRDVPLDVLGVAAQQCAVDCKFFPTVAEIRDKVALLTEREYLAAADAWATVVSALKSGRFYFSNPTFDDPMIQRVIDAMDWEELKSSENPMADRAHFIKLYDSLVIRDRQDKKLLPAFQDLRSQLTEAHEPRQLQAGQADAGRE